MALTYLFGYSEFIVMLSNSIDVETHSHHAIQLTVGLERPVIVHHNQQLISGTGVFIASDIAHVLDSQGGATITYLVHPESQLGVALRRGLLGEQPIGILTDKHPLIHHEWASLNCESMNQIAMAFWKSLPHYLANNSPIDPRIQAIFHYIHKMDIVKVSVHTLADKVHLSPSRFMALFRKETGIALRHYVLWHRLLKALSQILAGMSFTTAAHEVGFADASHLTRTFKEMFGITLQSVFMSGEFIQATFCDEEIE
ncbi:MAG: helix-turn-helix transcriptional regulator [bacterium]|nr:helix-turn-helix transcriptional regulator [bacterium]